MDNSVDTLFPSRESLETGTLDSLVRAWAAHQPQRPLLSFGGRITNADTLLRRVKAAAAQLQQWEVGAGDRLALWAQNSEAWVVWFLASAWRGAAVVALHPSLQPEELSRALKHSRPKWLVADEASRGRDSRVVVEGVMDAMSGVGPQDNALGAMGTYFMRNVDGFTCLDEIYGAELCVPPAHDDPDATAALVFTSGSSGQPKLVKLTHRALIANALGTAELAGITADDRIASPLPLYHAGGLSSGLVLSLATGALWCSQARFDADDLLREIVDRQCTVVQGVPTMFKALIAKVSVAPLPGASLRLGFVGGARASEALCRLAESTLGLERMCVTYGQTEFGASIALTTDNEPDVPSDGKAGSPIPGATLRIVDPVDNALLPSGAIGEIQVCGPTLMQGYFNDPAATSKAIVDGGWLRTGDLGRMREGCLYVLGRLKDMIIRGGENVAATEVEDALLQLPGIAEICAVPVYSEYWGETVCVVVQPLPGHQLEVDTLRAHAQATLPRYKQPEHYLFWPALPLLASGKINRQEVKSQAATELSLPPLS